MARSDKFYGHSPEVKRDEEDGKVKVVKKDKETEKKEPDSAPDAQKVMAGTEGIPIAARHNVERAEVKHKHLKEKMDMHIKHQTEHAHHPESASKEELHKRHEEEIASMNKRQLSETKDMHARHVKELQGRGEESKK